jgi:hypothetical protein
MKKNVSKWFWMIFIVTIAFSLTTSTALAEGSGKGTKEGIKVHGHWKIEVFNPDGSRVSVTEFDNVIINSGISTLVNIMGGDGVHGAWGIDLGSNPAALPCDNTGTAVICKIGESGVTYGGITLHSTDLSVTAFSQQFTLSGSVIADNTTTIDTVVTASSWCAGTTISIGACRSALSNIWTIFTIASLGTPPSVVTGQLIQVTVTFSFS